MSQLITSYEAYVKAVLKQEQEDFELKCWLEEDLASPAASKLKEVAPDTEFDISVMVEVEDV